MGGQSTIGHCVMLGLYPDDSRKLYKGLKQETNTLSSVWNTCLKTLKAEEQKAVRLSGTCLESQHLVR